MFDISEWSDDTHSYGSCKYYEGVPDDVSKRALEIMRELRALSSDLHIKIEIWPLSESLKEFIRKYYNETDKR